MLWELRGANGRAGKAPEQGGPRDVTGTTEGSAQPQESTGKGEVQLQIIQITNFPIAGREPDQRDASGMTGREHSSRHSKKKKKNSFIHITPPAKNPVPDLPSPLVIQNIDTSSHCTISIQPIINSSLITEPAAHNKCL